MKERILLAIVWRLPRPLVYWSAIRLGVEATTDASGSTVVPGDLRLMDALKRWCE